MFGLTFLSKEKTKLLQQYRDSLALAKTPRARDEILLAIQNLEVQAVPYQKCDLAAADELRSQILGKINTLASIGKAGSSGAVFLQMQLKDVEFHIATLQMQEHMAEQEKMPQPDDAPNDANKALTISQQRREKKKQEAFGHQRWTINFDDEPDSTNK